MQIEKNPKQLAAMEQFHKGNRPEGLRLQEEFAAQFREEYKDKDHCPARRPAAITATARSVWRFTGRIRSTSPTVCGRSSTPK